MFCKRVEWVRGMFLFVLCGIMTSIIFDFRASALKSQSYAMFRLVFSIVSTLFFLFVGKCFDRFHCLEFIDSVKEQVERYDFHESCSLL